jgi:hypothetical protein
VGVGEYTRAMEWPDEPKLIYAIARWQRNVGAWHFCDMVLCRLEFRLRRLSGRGAETSGRPGLTDGVDKVGDASAVPPIWVLWRQFSPHWPSLPQGMG